MWRIQCLGSARADNVKSNRRKTQGEMYLCNARYLSGRLATRVDYPAQMIGRNEVVQYHGKQWSLISSLALKPPDSLLSAPGSDCVQLRGWW